MYALNLSFMAMFADAIQIPAVRRALQYAVNVPHLHS
jgi:hypothetical protein